MEISLSLLLFSCFVSNYLIHFVVSDPSFGVPVGGWGSTGIDATGTSVTAPSTDQLNLWAINSSFHDGPRVSTNLNGNPVPSLTASQGIGSRGHLLLQDHILIDKLASFNRERVPERSVHAKGAGAHGHFVVTHDISKYTKAKFLNGIGKKTRIFVRFSTVGGELGSADTAVDPNGFAIKFYTEDGNHDFVANNIESFPIRDPMLFTDMSRSRKRNPQTHMKDQNMWWDFVSLRPESTLQMLHLFSDIGRPDGYRKMDGFAAHAFKCVNEHNQVTFCKFLWKTNQPGPALTYQEAAELAGSNPEYKTQDLYDAIARGDFPTWDLSIQIMTVEQAKKYPRNPFDITRTWREEEFPYIPVGRITLNRNPVNYFAEVEQVGFSLAMVPGIEPSPDRILAGRLVGYPDALRYRLGVNWPHLPINRPVVEVNSYMRDGQACYTDNGGGSPNYFPNSFGGSVADTVGARQLNFHVEGVVDRYDIPEDEYIEARIFMERDVRDPAHRQRLIESIATRLKDARQEIRERALKMNFYPVSKKLGDEVREAVQRHLENSTSIVTNSGTDDNKWNHW